MSNQGFITSMDLDEETMAALAAAMETATQGTLPSRSSVEACELDAKLDMDASYDELMQAMSSDDYWYKFYLRPCCPAPGYNGAKTYAEHLKDDVAERNDFTPDQAEAMCRVIDERLEWYSHLGVCKS